MKISTFFLAGLVFFGSIPWATASDKPISTGQGKIASLISPSQKKLGPYYGKQDPSKLLSTSYVKNIAKETGKELSTFDRISTTSLIITCYFLPFIPTPFIVLLGIIGAMELVKIALSLATGVGNGIEKTKQNRLIAKLQIPKEFNFDTLQIPRDLKTHLKTISPKTIIDVASIKGISELSLNQIILAILEAQDSQPISK